MTGTLMEDRARALREAFDRSFAASPRDQADGGENYLGIRIGSDAFVLKLGEIKGLFSGRTIVSLPSSFTEILGVASLRGQVVPVYSLRAFLGYPPAKEPLHWIVLAGPGVGFAFDQFDFYARIPPEQISHSSSGRGHIASMATVAGAHRPVISIGSLLQTIARRNPISLKEH
jgi:chemotaxis signal transduction protein